MAVKNYITPAGAKKLQAELHDLLHVKRPEMTATVAWAASNGDRSENADYIYGKRRLREIDLPIRFLTQRIEAFEIINPTTIRSEQVLFGATVTICDEAGAETIYSIVGADEIDPSKGHISWNAPLAKALLKSKVGHIVSFQSPKGPREVEVIEIKYIEIR